jgi:nuclear transport factor 2 (NTF2) superfamily protein
MKKLFVICEAHNDCDNGKCRHSVEHWSARDCSNVCLIYNGKSSCKNIIILERKEKLKKLNSL